MASLEQSFYHVQTEYIKDLLEQQNEWMKLLLSSTKSSANILALYQVLMRPDKSTVQKFMSIYNIKDVNMALFKMEEIIVNINAIINNAPTYDEDIIVWRGTVTSSITENQTLSTSTSVDVAQQFTGTGGELSKIILPKGQHFLYLENVSDVPGEFEVLLPFGSVFTNYEILSTTTPQLTYSSKIYAGVLPITSILDKELIKRSMKTISVKEQLMIDAGKEQAIRAQKKIDDRKRQKGTAEEKKSGGTRKRSKRRVKSRKHRI
jgi:hypothetical protein